MLSRKKQIPKAVKREVWNKIIGEEIGKSKCQCCEKTDITQLNFQCGHIQSEAEGGEIHVNNLLPICEVCNSSMGTKNLYEFKKMLVESKENKSISIFIHKPYTKDIDTEKKIQKSAKEAQTEYAKKYNKKRSSAEEYCNDCKINIKLISLTKHKLCKKHIQNSNRHSVNKYEFIYEQVEEMKNGDIDNKSKILNKIYNFIKNECIVDIENYKTNGELDIEDDFLESREINGVKYLIDSSEYIYNMDSQELLGKLSEKDKTQILFLKDYKD